MITELLGLWKTTENAHEPNIYKLGPNDSSSQMNAALGDICRPYSDVIHRDVQIGRRVLGQRFADILNKAGGEGGGVSPLPSLSPPSPSCLPPCLRS